ncbi:MAG: bifunctional diaminohydroxyphosphoribosylaminopyrimidine deaminase/5-amino-6-(5-phosphoribosylamino)uracil reductase RibD [Spirochaetales bacterium]|nr:bifunctional diaminohydroxyphosphoribosylaminopyrimidine deaminase/5-amino-6-(5-phosphoribosylamino)uracil reductase RibD [Spirochaetales bacterium]
MKMCFHLAKNALGYTSPNPLVGSVVVKNGIVAGKGFHAQAGADHAEIVSLKKAAGKAAGATLYVNLEPCSHHGRTPPCVDAIINAGISRVVIAIADPNPLVAGKGIQKLRAAGINVTVGILEDRARHLNEVFIKHITTRQPFIAVKAAASLDGRIATAAGHSQWITGEKSRQFGHSLRQKYDAILTGIGTVLADDPLLTVRLNSGKTRNPVRIVLDSRAEIPVESKLVKTAKEIQTIIAVTSEALPGKIKTLTKLGCQILLANGENRKIDLEDCVQKIENIGVTSILVESGGTLAASFMENLLFDKLYLFSAPLIIGGEKAPSFIMGKGAVNLSQAIRLHRESICHLGDDLLCEYYPLPYTAPVAKTEAD